MLSQTSQGLLNQFERRMKELENEVEGLKEELNVRVQREAHMARHFELCYNIGQMEKAGTLGNTKPHSIKQSGVICQNMLFDLDNKRGLQHAVITKKYLPH